MPNSPAPEALFTRLYFDRHIMARLAIDLRSRGYDVLTTEEAGLDTATDEQQLTFVALLGGSHLPAALFVVGRQWSVAGSQQVQRTTDQGNERVRHSEPGLV